MESPGPSPVRSCTSKATVRGSSPGGASRPAQLRPATNGGPSCLLDHPGPRRGGPPCCCNRSGRSGVSVGPSSSRRAARGPGRLRAVLQRLPAAAVGAVRGHGRRPPRGGGCAAGGLCPRVAALALLRLAPPPPSGPELSTESVDLAAALRALPMGQRQVIVLHHLVGLPVDEIARQLRLPSGTVKSHLTRGRRSLARRLGLATAQEVQIDG
jgi:DNA-directed RNA polymerase specialized sigma24 family protein